MKKLSKLPEHKENGIATMRIGKPVIRLLIVGVSFCLAAKVVIPFFNQPMDDLKVLQIRDLVDETGQLTDNFKEELRLKDTLQQQALQASTLDEENRVPVPIAEPNVAGTDNREGWMKEDVSDMKLSAINRDSYFRGDNVPDDVLSMNRPTYLRNYKNPCWYEAQSDQNGSKVLRCLPYFHLLGVDKSGTTDLWYRMTQHPDIVKPNAVMDKETHWWSWRRFGFDIWVRNKEIYHFDWYLKHFDSPARKIEHKVVQRGNKLFHPLVTGEGSPTVFWDFTGWDMIPQNEGRPPETAYLTPHCIQHLTPKAKFLVIFRDPTSRLYSDYVFLDRFRSFHNVSVKGFHQEVQRSIAMLTHCFAKKSQTQCLYDKELHMRIPVRLIVGMYDIFLKEWLKVFTPQQILVLRNEDYSKNIATYLKAVFRFLDLSPLTDAELDRIAELPRVFETTQAKTLGPMMNETRALLDNFYAEYNKQLAGRFGDPKFLWKD